MSSNIFTNHNRSADTHANLNTSNRYDKLWLILCLIGYGVSQALLINSQPLTYDEGLHLQISHFLKLGYEPYTQIFTLANPLFIWLLGLLSEMSLPLTGYRPVFCLLSFLFIINVAAVARFWLGSKGALGAVFLLTSAVTFLAEASTITEVIPALSIGTLSLTCAIYYLNTKQSHWLILGGIFWAAALFIATSVLPIGLVTLLLIIFSDPDPNNRTIRMHINGRFITKTIGFWLTGTIVGLAIGLFLTTPGLIFDHLFKDLATMRQNLPLKPQISFVPLGHFLAFNIWLFIFAIYTLVRLSKKPNHVLWLAVIWLLISFGWLMLQVRLRLIDFAILFPPLAILAGWGLVDVGHRLRNVFPHRKFAPVNYQLQIVVITLFMLAFYLLVSWQRFYEFTLRNVNTADDWTQIQQRPALAQFIQNYTSEHNCVLIDDPALAVRANRWPTPELVGLSEERINSGLLTDRQLGRLITEGQCRAIVFSNREYNEYFKGFGGWLRQNYPNEEKFIRTRIHYR